MTVFELANVSYHNKIKIYVGVLFIYIEMMYDIYFKKKQDKVVLLLPSYYTHDIIEKGSRNFHGIYEGQTLFALDKYIGRRKTSPVFFPT